MRPIRMAWDNAGMAALVNSNEMAAFARGMAELGMAHAVSISPRSNRKKGQHYQDLFKVKRIKINDSRGRSRVGAALVNASEHAWAVEWGTDGTRGKPQRAQNVLSRTVSFIEGAS